MMTEQEAKTKWCPAVRFDTGRSGVNRWKQSEPPEEPHALNPVPCRCIASECMAWRWERIPHPNATGGFVWGRVHGYCGLAGQP